jgi:hypothetical protein
MEQSFQLKYFGRYSLFEQDLMTAEERNWNLKRLDRQIKEENKQSQRGATSPHVPRPPHA